MVLLAATPAISAGFEQVTVPDPGAAPLEAGIWYPSDAPALPQRLGLFEQTVAACGAVAGHGLPLIVMSHGSGGSFEGHYDTALALAEAGFVVAAVTHTATTIGIRAPSRGSKAVDVTSALCWTTCSGHGGTMTYSIRRASACLASRQAVSRRW
jgi:predicted dienelactone hydrolase